MGSGQLLFLLAIDSRFDNIELVQTALAASLEQLGVAKDASHWIDVAVREAVANAIKHGNRLDPGKRVEIRLSLEEADLVISVRDQGGGFDPRAVEDPLAASNLLRPNGRGIFYMKSFMDRVDYSSAPEGGTVVTLRKRMVQQESA